MIASTWATLRAESGLRTSPNREPADRRCELESERGEDSVRLLQDLFGGQRVIVDSTIRFDR